MESKASSIPQKPKGILTPLSLAQQRLWFLYQLNPHSTEYNISRAWRLKGPLNTQALTCSLNLILDRHESLRTTFQEIDGQPVQVIQPTVNAPFQEWDWSTYPPAKLEAEIDRFLVDEPRQPFDLRTGPLLRFTLIRCEPDEHVLIFTIHHMVFDGTSLKVFCQELSHYYAGTLASQPTPLAPLPIQYQDYAHWQQAHVTDGKLAAQIQFWKQYLQGAPLVLELPSDDARPKDNSGPGSYRAFTLAPHVISNFKQLIQPQGITMFMGLLAVFQILLSRYTDQRDILVGTPIAGRTHTDLEDLIGFLVNTLVLRIQIVGQPTFSDVLRQVRTTCLQAYRHQDLPFEKLVEMLKPGRDPNRSPVVQAIFQFRQASDLRLFFPEVEINPFPVKRRTGNFDLHMVFEETSFGVEGFLYYPQELYSDSMMANFVKHYEVLLEELIANPLRPIHQTPFLTETETHQQLIAWNNTATNYSRDTCLHDLVQHQAMRTPDAIVLVYDDQHLTYRELTRRASQLANYLVSLGVGPEVRVGLCHERSAELLIGLLGILQAGGAYVPLDPTYPLDRLRFMTLDAQVPIVVTQEHLESIFPQESLIKVSLDRDGALIATQSEVKPTPPLTGDALAYVLYTSGSTGRPKGVQIEHRKVVNCLLAIDEKLKNPERAIVLTTTNFSFDISILEVFSPLTFGGRLILANQDQARDGHQLMETLARESITKMLATPAGWRVLLEANWKGKPDLVILTGGEALSEDLANQLLKRGAALWNLYGPTETTIFSTCTRIVPSETLTITIGSPVANTQTYIVNTEWQPVPIGVPGELHIGGDGVSRGYLNRPDLTAERFLPDPFSHSGGRRLYRTGDRARYRANGKIEWLGRLDHQVKLQGFRIELGEIEEALRDHPAVTETIVVCREKTPKEKQLVAYVAGQATVSELRPYLQVRLPGYMIPSAFIVLQQLPLTPNGKIDRKALPAPEGTDFTPGMSYVAPRTPMEQTLIAIWQDVLALKQVGIHDNFFELGGHSLSATQVVSRVRTQLQVEVTLLTFFQAPTVAGLAERLVPSADPVAQPIVPPLPPCVPTNPLPLSFAQQRLWFLYQLEPASAAYNMSLAYQLGGHLDVVALEQSLQMLMDRHDTLRTSFPLVEHQPMQTIVDSLVLPLVQQDLRGMSDVEREDKIHSLVREERNRLFDLATGPVFRALLIQLGNEEHVFVLTLHHIASDGWSLGVLNQELEVCYAAFTAGKVPTLPTLPIQYADFAVRQRGWLDRGVLEEQLNYWRKQLANVPPLALPTDLPRPPVQTYGGATHTLVVPQVLAVALRGLSQKRRVTLAITLLAAFNVLLAKYTGQTDLTVGTPIANRNQKDIEDLIGFFVNSLVMRTDLGGDPSLSEILQRVKVGSLEAYDHSDLPFERIVGELQPERDPSRNPLFQVLFAVQNAPSKELTLPGLIVTSIQPDTISTRFDLECHIWEKGEGLVVNFVYNTDLFETRTIERLGLKYQRVLEALVQDPKQRLSQITLLDEAECQQQLVEWNNTEKERPSFQSIHQFFEQQVKQTPDGIAMILEEGHCTYQELNRRANQLAHYLIRRGVGRDVWVGLCLGRSFDMVIGLLAILKAGGGYVPLDPDYPTDRLAFMVGDSQITIAVTQTDLLSRIPLNSSQLICLDRDWKFIEQEESRDPTSEVTRENVAYAIYTSGSTGRPKAVVLCHRTLINLIAWQITTHQLLHAAKTLQYASLGFDVSYQEMFTTWCSGGTLVLVPSKIKNDFFHLLQFLEQEAVERAFLPYVALQELARTAESQTVSPLKICEVISAGEQLRITDSIANLFGYWPDSRLINHYGPSESHVVTSYKLEGRPDKWPRFPPIGSPIDNTQIFLLDRFFHPVPIGVIGEIYIAGEGLAQGYLHQPAQTAEKFLPHPNFYGAGSGQRLYRTGDMGRYRPDGTIEFHGRHDHQIKLRGYRIELGEIEAALSKIHGVAETVVLCREDNRGEKQLVAYVKKAHERMEVAKLRTALQGHLPSYMVPSAFVVLETLPLTPNGKIDRNALPTPEVADRIQGMTYVAPRTPIEKTLIAIWQEVLGLERVGIHDNFFELGGHSLLATQVVSRVRTQLQVEVTLLTFFQVPTVAGLAEKLVPSADPVAQPIVPPLTPCARTNPLPLSFAQQRLWFLDQWEPNSALYNVASVFRLRGLLHVEALRNALMALVKRHESLRTIFLVVDDIPCQHIIDLEQLASPSLTIIEVPDKSGETHDATLHRMITEETCRPFDLTRGPLFRAQLLPVAENEAVFILTLHHIITDGWSMEILLKELAVLYAAEITGTTAHLPALPIQYADYAVWQRDWLQGGALTEELTYWRKQLTDAPPSLELFTDYPRPSKPSYRGERISFTLPQLLTREIKTLSQLEGVSLFMTLLAAFQVLLFRFTGQRDILVGAPLAGRIHNHIEGLIGFFANTLVLRSRFIGQPTFRDVLQQVKVTCLNAFDHQNLPFEKLVEALQPVRDSSRHPLFQIMFHLQHANSTGEFALPNLEVVPLHQVAQTAKFDISFGLIVKGETLEGTVTFNTDLFTPDTIKRLTLHYHLLLEGLLSHPTQAVNQVPLLTENERHQLLIEWNPPVSQDSSALRVHQIFEAQAARTPDTIAIVFGDEHLTYEALNHQANQLANYLAQQGIGPEVRVAFCLERSTNLLIALLGILKAGGVYMPLDPSTPVDRLTFMLTDAQVRIVLTQSSLLKQLQGQQRLNDLESPCQPKWIAMDDTTLDIRSCPSSNPRPIGAGENLAYVIYTSGSTGQPKGVAITQTNLLEFVQCSSKYLEIEPSDRVLQYASLSFDTAIEEIFPCLLRGGTLVLRPENMIETVSTFWESVNSFQLTVLDLPTAYWHELTNALSIRPVLLAGCVRMVVIGGEQARADQLAIWHQHMPSHLKLLNVYGPTEATVGAALGDLSLVSTQEVERPLRTVSIGHPMANRSIYIVDTYLQSMPIGVPGELYLGGQGLGRGYNDRQRLTAEAFIPDPFSRHPGSRLYRTGDRGRYRADGTIELLGRMDQQIKIRGYRVELDEIEFCLRQIPEIQDAVVLAQSQEQSHTSLVAYVVGHPHIPLSTTSIRQVLQRKLPHFMVPAGIIHMEELPRLPSGKVNRKALSFPSEFPSGNNTGGRGPETAVEESLVHLWKELLHLPSVNVRENFFELGGHSLLATRLLARLREIWHSDFPLRLLFDHPILEDQALVIEETLLKEIEDLSEEDLQNILKDQEPE